MRIVISSSPGDLAGVDSAMLIDRSHDAAMQLAIDEAMLLLADEGAFSDASEFLRIWEFQSPTVVLGRSSKFDLEVDAEECHARSIPIFRRASGGATVMGGPGCLMYSVVLNTKRNPEFKRIDQAHAYVMQRVLNAVQRQVAKAAWQGICDLTVDDQKFSGNSLRIGRNHLLYHGTVLYDFDLEMVQACLNFAPRQPEYRRDREHQDFVTNLTIKAEPFGHALKHEFQVVAECPVANFMDRANSLREAKYVTRAWQRRH